MDGGGDENTKRETDLTSRETGERRRRRNWISGLPFTAIRETDPITGHAQFIGDFKFHRSEFLEVLDEEERKVSKEKNDGLEAGHEDLVWDVGCEFLLFLSFTLIFPVLSSILEATFPLSSHLLPTS